MLHPHFPRGITRSIRKQFHISIPGKEWATTSLCYAIVSQCFIESHVVFCWPFSNLDLYTASDHLPKYLLGSKGASYDVTETPFQDAVGTTKPRWEWLEEKTPAQELSACGVGYPGIPQAKNITNKDELVARPEHEVFGLAMLGGGMVFGSAHPYGKRSYILWPLLLC